MSASFSPDYIAARSRFRSGSIALGCRLEELPIGHDGPDGNPLTIDVAILGAAEPQKAVVVSSGLHGVEGFFGSAVQAALLEEELGGYKPPDDTALVLIHALNPFGFAWIRRVNEDNVDLNRNFLLPDQAYSGVPDTYGQLDGLLNPRTPPSSLDPFLAKAAFNIAKYGMPALKNAVAGGQYEFSKGLFYGGSGPCTTVRLMDEHLPRWVGSARHVLHIDLHTGLGKSGTYKLLVDHEEGSDRAAWLAQRFGADVVEPWAPGGVSYAIRGGMGVWCKHRFPETEYDVMVAEFGTTGPLQVIAALRAENQAHHWARPEDDVTRRAKTRLREAFAPTKPAWRDTVVARGVRIVQQAIEALGG